MSYGPDETPHHGSLAGTIAAELLVPPVWAEPVDEVSKGSMEQEDAR